MEVELKEIQEFLAAHPPFEQLPEEVLSRLPKMLTVRYLRRSTPFPPPGEASKYLFIVRSGAVEFRNSQDKLLEKFAEGEICSSPCSDENDLGSDIEGMTVEDSLFYTLSCEDLQKIREHNSAFNEHFNHTVRERLRHAIKTLQESPQSGSSLMKVEVGTLISRDPVTAKPDISIKEAAGIMSENRVSCLLIVNDKKLVGLVTDRDLRTRVVAAGIDTRKPVSEIMTSKLHKVTDDTPGFEALNTMSRLAIHHLPVVKSGEVAGIISSNDLVRYQNTNSLYLVRDILKCKDLDTLIMTSRELPEMQLQLTASGVSAYQLGQAISSVTDAIVIKLIKLAQKNLGSEPVPFVWLAVGSHARREQTVHTDQDSAMILSDQYNEAEHGEYFKALSEYVTDGMNACGFVYCPGNVMARNPQWRQSYKVWRDYFNNWITRPERKSLMLACNFFDMRPLHGDVSLYEYLQAEVLKQTQDNRIFLAYMAANALQHRPPLGFFRNFVVINDEEHKNALNLKRRGLNPVIDLARVYAISVGLPEINTLERLHAAADTRDLSRGGAEDLEDALEFISMLRARHQMHQIRKGETVDNFVIPDTLSKQERSHLKDAFSVISTMQETLEQRYQAGRFF